MGGANERRVTGVECAHGWDDADGAGLTTATARPLAKFVHGTKDFHFS
jgi:hypothetical protein